MDSKKNTSGISRRTFFKGSAITLGGIAAGSTLPNLLTTEAAAQSATLANPSWEKRPTPIDAGEITKTVNADVIIIGDGLTGVCAALAVKECGLTPVIIEKNRMCAGRGCHITAFNTKYQKENKIEFPDNRQIIRELVRWAQGRVNEDLLWMFAEKSGACFEWAASKAEAKGLRVGLWNGYFKGPDYTEYPVTHIFEDIKTGERGNIPFVKALENTAKEQGIEIFYQTPAVQFIRKDNGPVTGVIAGKKGAYTQFNAKKGVIIASGDYASNMEMKKHYAPIAAMADAQIYFPNKCNTGDAHIMAMQAGAAMQQVEPHAAVIHLEAGAMSYGFLHVNAEGKRFKNEDVNTQSKSCTKLYQPDGVAWTIYDADGLKQVQEQIDSNKAGGLFYGQMTTFTGEKWDMEAEKRLLESHIKSGKVVVANTLDELAKKMNIPADNLKKTVERYNQLAKAGNDEDYGKRAEILRPIIKPPYYAGKLLATLLTMSGGLRTDTSLRCVDNNGKAVEGLYVAGAAAGDFFSADYPTICPGIGHGRCITFGRLAGILASGKSIDSIPSIKL